MSEEYPNDKETQEWLNAPLGKPETTPEEQVKFWSNKYDAKVDELHEMWKEARSFEGSFNAATEKIKEMETNLAEKDKEIENLKGEKFNMDVQINDLSEEIDFLKESRSKWAKQSSENADGLDLMLDEFKRIKALTDNLEIQGLCERAIKDIQQNVSVIAQRDNAEARETVLRRNLENAYAEAKRIYPEFDWAGFTQTSEIIVMALYDKIKIQDEKIKLMEAVIYAVGDYASNHKDDRFGARRRLLEAYENLKRGGK